MQINFRAILEDCIERGVEIAMVNHDSIPENYEMLREALERNIWLLLDNCFIFDDDFYA